MYEFHLDLLAVDITVKIEFVCDKESDFSYE